MVLVLFSGSSLDDPFSQVMYSLVAELCGPHQQQSCAVWVHARSTAYIRMEGTAASISHQISTHDRERDVRSKPVTFDTSA
jgi:hypothetical protein